MDNRTNNRRSACKLAIDIAVAIFAGIVVAVGFHVFVIYNGFVPGGVNGIATILYALTELNAGYYSIILNLPIYVLVYLLVKKQIGIMLTVYISSQALSLILLEKFSFPTYLMQDNLLLAALAGGVVSGLGFGLMLRQFGASGGTYAIAALIRRKNPAASVVWLSFVMDSSVVLAAFFVFEFKIEPAICTLVNLYIANKMAEGILQGIKTGYKYEIVTDSPDQLSHELIERLGGSVTRLPAQGMYTGTDKSMLVCVIKKRHMGEFQRILKGYPNTFVYITRVSEIMGGKFETRGPSI